MDEEEQSETPRGTTAGDEDGKATDNQASATVIEIHDSTTECEEEAPPPLLLMEEKSFISRLHAFMKGRGTAIERIPHLGFKQINLWRIYREVEKLGGYDTVTVRRLWKKVYDELGGSPGSTSAATCTRRHYEKLVLPFERHIKGEEDKPLPLSKPRKPYKRNLDGKLLKAERKRKRSQSDRETDSESPEAARQSDPAQWAAAAAAADLRHQDCSQTSRAASSLCTSVYARLVQLPSAGPWSAAEVISPLEKKKRLAQASLNRDGERPSVIQRSQSPSWAPSDGSPLPLSSSSSRSPSPFSVSSEDDKTASEKNSPIKSRSCSQKPKEAPRDVSLSSDSVKVLVRDPAWTPALRASGRYVPHVFHPSSSFTVKSDWAPTSTSSFTKVIPKPVQPLRPAPLRPRCKPPPARLMPHNDSLTKKLSSTSPWLYQAERRDKSRTILHKVPGPQQTPPPSGAGLLTSYDKAGRDSRHQPVVHPAFLSSRMRLPHSQLMYRHVPVSPALIGSAVYPYPYSIPLFNPQTAFGLPTMSPVYPHKM